MIIAHPPAATAGLHYNRYAWVATASAHRARGRIAGQALDALVQMEDAGRLDFHACLEIADIAANFSRSSSSTRSS